MESAHHKGQADRRCEEVGELAQRYLNNPGFGGVCEIDLRIAEAMADSRWDDMSKWHRVKLRLMRMQQQRALAGSLGGGK